MSGRGKGVTVAARRAEKVREAGLAAARKARAEEAAWLGARLAACSAMAADVRARQEGMGALIADAVAKLNARSERWVKAQDRLAIDAAKGRNADRHRARVARLGRMAGLVEATRARIARLEVEREELPDRLARLEAAIADLRARLEPDALDQAAAKSGARAMGRAREAQAAEDAARPLDRARAVERAYDRDGPTAQQMARRGVEKAGSAHEAHRLGADVPDAIRRLQRAGKIEARHVDAAVRYGQDHRFGTDRAKLVASYEMGVDGSGGAGEISAARLDAFRRWRAASEAVPAEFRSVLDAVIFSDVSLADAPGEAIRYAKGETNRRSANGMLLVMGLTRLADWYSRH